MNCSIDEFPVIRNALHPHRVQIEAGLWRSLHDSGQPTANRFRAGLALAAYAAQSPNWTEDDAKFLCDRLLVSNPDDQRALRSHLRPLAASLVAPLELIYRDSTVRDPIREAAAHTLADFAGGDVSRVARLVSDGTPAQFEILLPLVLRSTHRGMATAELLKLVRDKVGLEADEGGW